MNYYQFRAEDFAADDYFKQWVCSPDAESEAFWQEFLKDYPEKYYQLNEGKILVQALHHINKIKADEPQVARVWSRIEDTVALKNKSGFRGWVKRYYVWQVAASVLLVLGAAGLWHTRQANTQQIAGTKPASGQWEEAANDTDQPMGVLLADGSKVLLEKNSRLRYTREFDGGQREVYLHGAAFFEVRKNPEKPFLVYANGLITKVLGTSFRVQAHDGDPNVTVAVSTGRVSVYSGNTARAQDPEVHGIILTPNQKAIFQRDIRTLSKTLVEKPTILVEKNHLPSFSFEDVPAADVFQTLEKVYGIDVVFDEELMKNCTLTVNLSKEDLFQKLEVICKVLEVSYKLIDAQVIIYSKGC
ncbi:hypothetical protein DYBT9275_00047 [Dyadobacter sp. CECT 9275]|uniref:FecR family protein n=1 Tax=Dyadobacter helix TaxID=2822344 RepID=A0A916N3V2_9BACT|nr:FecR family protein [Dyadobacter sp. CECT 9275]CAG4988298.1 hypothetical protein DYBT9275_00047 [Dyadobacter sp. CECT 9275]